MLSKKNSPEIYLISPNKIVKKEFLEILNNILSFGLIKIFQLRIKNCELDYVNELIKAIRPICKFNKVLFILNDYAELVKVNNLDGVHVGSQDFSIKKCREVLGKNKIIGKSCYNSPSLALKAQKAGANYIAFGSFFKTNTKKDTRKLNINDIIGCKKNIHIPTVGIGGINKNNFFKIKRVYLDYIAISAAVWGINQSPVEALKKIKNVIDNY